MLNEMGLPRWYLEEVVGQALVEDVWAGDLTTTPGISATQRAEGTFIAQERLVVAGLGVAHVAFSLLDWEITFIERHPDGNQVNAGDVLAIVEGPARALLTAERVALNFLQRLSGIATLTRSYVERVSRYRAKILDTRKTTPGLRLLEKYAVRVGGGHNHRFNLSSGILIKNNHLALAGDMRALLKRIKVEAPLLTKVEVEVENLAQLEEALEAGVDLILLDNMTPEQVKQAVELVGGRVPLEVSGGITLDNVESYAATGVDFISVGALTHSFRSVDISFSIRPLD